jgi:amino acid transporter
MDSSTSRPTLPGSPPPGNQLARGAIGLREVLFQSITHMAPAAAVAITIVIGANFAGGAEPLSVIFALVGCLLVAISIGQLAKHLPSAGGFYTYTARGLHPTVGFLVAWGYAFVEPLIAPALYMVFAGVVAGTLRDEFGWNFGIWWVVAALAAAVLVFLLGYFGIQISARIGTLLGLFEIGVFAVLAVWLIVKAGDKNTLEVFGTKFATVEGFTGISGVIAGSVYTILAFIGFEAAAPLAEEAKDPRKTIGRAVVYSCIGIGAFYILTTYASTVFFGPARYAEFPTAGGGNPWDAVARMVWGAGWVLVFLAIANSAIANANAGSNAATRTLYAMGRIRLLPAILQRTHPRYRSPHVSVFVQLVIGVGVALWLGAQYNNPFTVFGILGTIIGVVVIAIYMLVNLSCLIYFLRERPTEFNWFLHGVIPIAGIVAFLPAFLVAIGVGGSVLSFIAPLTYPFNVAGPVVGIWYAIGIVYLIYLSVRAPQRLKDTAKVFIEEEVAEVSAPV